MTLVRRSGLLLIAGVLAVATAGCGTAPGPTAYMEDKAEAKAAAEDQPVRRDLPEPPVAHYVVE
ncbi:hypothetical protein [Roseospira navarrensis]|uniref:Argininosuccinate lyase n=1 Tax=Roseospira navarrensis TaxID=140058 RepID=A0A7X1ZD71_9PROT|nr:hypothetical protein [Roseospira navarrensis]MQX36177.1 hypothetical protein [Roseospira navarrensis]